jgi:hypothetical protein
MDSNKLPEIINSKAFTYLVLTLCFLVAANFTVKIINESGLIKTRK